MTHRYQELVDHLPVAILVNRDDRVFVANATCAALLGAGSPSEIIGRSPLDFVPPRDHDAVRERIRGLRDHGAPVSAVRQRLVRLDGTTVDAELAAFAFDDGGGRTIYVVLRDVTEDRRSAARIEHLNAMLQGVRRVNQLITRERHPDVLLQRSAEILVEARGLTSATIVLRDPFGFRVGASAGAPDRGAHLSALIASGEAPPCILRASGGEVVVADPATDCPGCAGASRAGRPHVAITLPLESEGHRFGVLHAVLPHGVSSDVEEAALLGELASDVAFALRSIELEDQVGRTQESLQAMGEIVNALVAFSSTAIVTFDAEGRVTGWNRGSEALFGWSAEQAIGRSTPFEETVTLADPRSMYRRVLADELTFPLEETVARRSGEPVDVAFSAVALRAPDGKPGALMCVFEDVTARKAAERALRESEERFRTEFEHAAAGRCIATPDGRIVRANRSLAAMLDVTAESLIGRPTGELVHPDDRSWSRESGQRLLAGHGSSFRCEIRLLRRDGSHVWVDLDTALYRDASGAPVHFIADAHDLTARKEAEAASIRSWARMETLSQVISDLSSARAVQDVAPLIQRAARDLVGADAACFILRSGEALTFFGPEEGAEPRGGGPSSRVELAGAEALAHPDLLCVEDLAADPRFASAPASPLRGAAFWVLGRGHARAALGVCWKSPHRATEEDLGALRALSDATSVALENVSVYEELRRSREGYRDLIESLDDLVFAVDRDGRLTYVSGAIARFGYAPAEVMGRRFQEFTHPDDRDGTQRAFDERLLEDVGPYEFRVFDAEGKVRFVRSSCKRVFEGGRVSGLAGVLIDLTTQRSTEEQLRAAQKMEAVGRLAGGVAHDFNNLLTVITSYAGLAARGLPEGDQRRADVAEVRKAADRATALTRQLLAFSRRQVLQPEIIDLNTLVQGTERMLARLIGEDVELRVVGSPGAGRIRADPGQIEQVLMNLAVNARDAMPSGGILTISTGDAVLDDAFVQRHVDAKPGSFVRLRVSDTGTGMDAATLERLFEPFFTTKPPGKGTGLGLAMVYGIVQQSGGNVWVESEPGHGSTFDVYFPRVDDAVVESPSPTPSPDAGRRAGTILFVEDDEAIRNLAQRVLSLEGYTVVAAANGGEALVLADRHGHCVDLVVTDVVMPGMSGRELAARLRPSLRHAPILFMSGYGHDAIARHGVLEPGTHFLPKPFTSEALLEKIGEVLRTRR